MSARWLQQLPLALLLVAATGLAQLSLDRGHDWGDDFAGYILQAQSVLDGRMREELELSRYTIEHSEPPPGPAAYPWGTPLLLAPVLGIAGLDFLALKHVNLLCFALLLAVSGYGLGRSLSRPYRFLLVALLACTPALFVRLNAVLSDIPFAFASTLAVVLIGRRLDGWGGRTRAGLLLGAVLAFAISLRTNGLLLVATLAAVDLPPLVAAFRGGAKRDALARLALPYLVVAAVAIASAATFPMDNAALFAMLFDYPQGAWAHLQYYASLPPEFLGELPGKELLFWLSVPLAIAGFARHARRDQHLAIYCVLTLALLFAWPFRAGPRFLFPLLPIYLSWLVGGLEWLAPFGPARSAWRFAVVACLGAALSVALTRPLVELAASNLRDGRERQLPGPTQPSAKEMYAFVRSHVPGDSVVLAYKPRAMRLFGRHQSYRTSNPAHFPASGYYCHYRNYPGLAQLSEADLAAMVQSRRLELRFRNADFELYEVRGAP